MLELAQSEQGRRGWEMKVERWAGYSRECGFILSALGGSSGPAHVAPLGALCHVGFHVRGAKHTEWVFFPGGEPFRPWRGALSWGPSLRT